MTTNKPAERWQILAAQFFTMCASDTGRADAIRKGDRKRVAACLEPWLVNGTRDHREAARRVAQAIEDSHEQPHGND
jgi:hypothetical protein